MRDVLLMVGWGLVAYASIFMAVASFQYVLGDPQEFTPPFRDRYLQHLPVVRLHGLCALTVLALSPLQFVAWLRALSPALHRALGRVVLVALTVAAPNAFLLGMLAPGGLATKSAVALMASLWLFAGWRGFRAIRSGDVVGHRAWMIRCFALTLTTVICRLYLCRLEEMGYDFAVAYWWVTCVGWIPNVLAAEAYLLLEPRPRP